MVDLLQFLGPFPEGKNSNKGHRAISSSRSFIKPSKLKHSPGEKRAGCLARNQKQPRSEGRAASISFQSSGESLPVSCIIWLTRWLTALGYITFLLVHRHLPISTQAKPMGVRRRAKNHNIIYYKYGIMDLGYFGSPLGLGACAPTGAGSLESPAVFLTFDLGLIMLGTG